MADHSRAQLNGIPLRSLKVELDRGEGGVQKLKEAGAVLDKARLAAGLEAKQMADDMAISQSLVLRGLKGVDHLSFHRLWMLPDAFWLELIVLAIERRGMAEVRRQITIDANLKVG